MSAERPILLNDEMVRAILEGWKTQTRRVIKPQPTLCERSGFRWKGYAYGIGSDHLETQCNFARPACPQGKPGDRLWVRETWCAVDDTELDGERWVDYRATPKYSAEHPAGWENAPDSPEALKWRPSIHMPRWASRITLEITDVRVERLQDISEDDSMAEGILFEGDQPSPRDNFSALWELINGPDSWDANPWVWVIEFKRVNQEDKAA